MVHTDCSDLNVTANILVPANMGSASPTSSSISTLSRKVTLPQAILTYFIPAPEMDAFLSGLNTIAHDAHKMFVVVPLSFYVFLIGDVGILSSGNKPSKPPWSLVYACLVDSGKCVEHITYLEKLQWKPPWVYPAYIGTTSYYLTTSFMMEFMVSKTKKDNRRCMVFKLGLLKIQ
ncbi:hypothetical protein BS78_01G070700 [Paspalum vaginatum]|nr:hypothetical protein BS78_01G070700 [Paspalum vaginatum]